MEIRQVPPALGSVSQEMTVDPWGPHQRIKCSGSVNASKTSSRGASKMRSMTSTRSAGSGTTLLLVAMSLLLDLEQRELSSQLSLSGVEAGKGLSNPRRRMRPGVHALHICLQPWEAVEQLHFVGPVESVGEHEVGDRHGVSHGELTSFQVLFEHSRHRLEILAGEHHVLW